MTSSAAVDTNVLASGVAGDDLQSPPVQVMRRWLQGEFDLVISLHILEEFERTLYKPYFHARMGTAAINHWLHILRSRAQLTPLTVIPEGAATHREDDLVLATAISGNAAYLVTGDRQLLALGSYQGVAIVTARAFLDMLDQE